MKTARFDTMHLVLAALVGAMSVVAVGNPIPVAFADGEGTWKCYVSDRMSDLNDASSWGPLPVIAKSLDQLASSSPRGTIVPFSPKSGAYPSAFCIKQ